MSDPGERDTEDRRPAQQRAIARRELVDAGRDERFDRVRQLLGLVQAFADAGELLQKERVACAALHKRRKLFVGQASISGGCVNERLCVVDGKRLEPQCQRRKRRSSLRGRESAFDGAPRRAREPRTRRELRAEVAQELGRCVVHPVDVVEHEQGG